MKTESYQLIENLTQHLELRQFDITLSLKKSGYLPEYKGGLIRGLFGRLLYTCAPEIYERHFKPLGSTPSAFVFHPPNDNKCYFKKNDTLSFSVILIGFDDETTFKCLESFVAGEVYRIGIGKKSMPYEVSSVKRIPLSFDWEGLSADETIRVCFITPLIMKKDNNRLNHITPFHLFQFAARRLSQIDHFYFGDKLKVEIPQEKDLYFPEDQVKTNLEWKRVQVGSCHQNNISLSGLVGTITFPINEFLRMNGGQIKPWLFYLVAGQWLHIGAKTLYGCGQYSISKVP